MKNLICSAAKVGSSLKTGLCAALLATGLMVSAQHANAAQWSTTEAQIQVGRLDVPTFAAGGGEQDTFILTLQHASGWKWGDIFFFIDFLSARSNRQLPFNIEDAYGEIYFNFSSSKIFGINYGKGLLKDIGLIQGLNYGADPNVFKYLPGIRLSWNLPGFAFLNTDFMAYLDDSGGLGSTATAAPAEDDSWMVDINWAYPFELVGQKFSIEGHVEYIASRKNELGFTVEDWVLAQPQFRWDIGNAVFGEANQFFVGIEYQYWMNKLGDKNTDESAVQALGVWRF